MNRPSITDWIQAAAIVIGLAFAVYELRFSDRKLEREQKDRVFLLHEQILSDPEMATVSDTLDTLAIGLSPSSATQRQAMDALQKMHRKLFGLAYCYEHDLCDPTLSETMFCPYFNYYSAAEESVFRKFGSRIHFIEGMSAKETVLWNICLEEKT